MKRIIKKIVIVIFFTSLMMIQGPNQGQSSYVYSVRAQKTTFNHTLDDYSDAESISINWNMLVRTIYIKNSENTLYVGLCALQNSSLKGIALIFDVDHDQKYAEDVKILFVNDTKEDGYFYQYSALSLQATTFFDGGVYQVTYIDGKSYNLFQFSIPLNPNSDPTVDMFISDPSDYMLGFDFVEILNSSLISWTRGNLEIENTILKLDSNASSFNTLILAGPGKYAAPEFSPVVQNNQSYVASSSTQTNKLEQPQREIASASTPGFEFYILIIALLIPIGVKKIISRRKKQ